MTATAKNIIIHGKRWFNRTHGNTYFSAVAYVNGALVEAIDYEYGYGNQYADSMLGKLEKNGHIKPRVKYDNGMHEGMYQYCEREGIEYHYSVSDVARKKDL